jgi:hypothetical protein
MFSQGSRFSSESTMDTTWHFDYKSNHGSRLVSDTNAAKPTSYTK